MLSFWPTNSNAGVGFGFVLGGGTTGGCTCTNGGTTTGGTGGLGGTGCSTTTTGGVVEEDDDEEELVDEEEPERSVPTVCDVVLPFVNTSIGDDVEEDEEVLELVDDDALSTDTPLLVPADAVLVVESGSVEPEPVAGAVCPGKYWVRFCASVAIRPARSGIILIKSPMAIRSSC